MIPPRTWSAVAVCFSLIIISCGESPDDLCVSDPSQAGCADTSPSHPIAVTLDSTSRVRIHGDGFIVPQDQLTSFNFLVQSEVAGHFVATVTSPHRDEFAVLNVSDPEFGADETFTESISVAMLPGDTLLEEAEIVLTIESVPGDDVTLEPPYTFSHTLKVTPDAPAEEPLPARDDITIALESSSAVQLFGESDFLIPRGALTAFNFIMRSEVPGEFVVQVHADRDEFTYLETSSQELTHAQGDFVDFFSVALIPQEDAPTGQANVTLTIISKSDNEPAVTPPFHYSRTLGLVY